MASPWLRRQTRDAFVLERIARNLRSRSAIKLEQLDDKSKLYLRKCHRGIVDIGAAPGGWCEIARERAPPSCVVVGLDLLAVEPLQGVEFVQGDMKKEESVALVLQKLNGLRPNLVMCDIAPNAVGDRQADAARQIELARAALRFARRVGADAFWCKVFQGEDEPAFMKEIKAAFVNVQRVKPAASRSESKEAYVTAFQPRPPAAP